MFTLNVVITSELWGLRHHGECLNASDGQTPAQPSDQGVTRFLGANYMLFDGVTSVFGTLGMAKYACTSS